jgi:hypothetical protein
VSLILDSRIPGHIDQVNQLLELGDVRYLLAVPLFGVYFVCSKIFFACLDGHIYKFVCIVC